MRHSCADRHSHGFLQALLEFRAVSQREKAQMEQLLQDMTSQRTALQAQLDQVTQETSQETMNLRQEVASLKQQIHQLQAVREPELAEVYQRSCADLQRVAALYLQRSHALR